MNLIVELFLAANLIWTLYLTYLFVRKKNNASPSTPSETLADFTKIHLVRFNPFENWVAIKVLSWYYWIVT